VSRSHLPQAVGPLLVWTPQAGCSRWLLPPCQTWWRVVRGTASFGCGECSPANTAVQARYGRCVTVGIGVSHIGVSCRDATAHAACWYRLLYPFLAQHRGVCV